MKRSIILASGSPRRRELLAMIGADYTVRCADCDENCALADPREYVKELALRKARAAAALSAKEMEAGALVLGADTVVYDGTRILGKPSGREEAVETVLSLAGREHSVFTGVALVGREGFAVDAVETKVRFGDISRAEAERYAATGEPLDKAGSYGIQGIGGVFVTSLTGDYYNVVGLPVARLRVMLAERFGCELF